MGTVGLWGQWVYGDGGFMGTVGRASEDRRVQSGMGGSHF